MKATNPSNPQVFLSIFVSYVLYWSLMMKSLTQLTRRLSQQKFYNLWWREWDDLISPFNTFTLKSTLLPDSTSTQTSTAQHHRTLFMVSPPPRILGGPNFFKEVQAWYPLSFPDDRIFRFKFLNLPWGVANQNQKPIFGVSHLLFQIIAFLSDMPNLPFHIANPLKMAFLATFS